MNGEHHHGKNHNHSHDHGQSHDHNDSHDRSPNHGHDHGHNHNDGHRHSHGHHGHHHHYDAAGNRSGLIIALSITAGILILEFVGGLLTNSLALLSDSGHMLSDVTALALSLLAARFATRPASPSKTYGYHRFEILAALLNAVALFVVAGFIAWEAVGRMFEPPEVSSLPMMAIAAVGLLANLASAWALMSKGDVKNNVNLRSAYLHVLSDALGSIGAIVAGLVIYAFGWTIADPIISVVVAVLILRSAWGVIKNTLHVLMEGAPGSIDHQQVKQALANLDGVLDVHDLHIWTITSGMDSISCHLRIDDLADGQRLLQQALRLLEERFGVLHATVQIEDSRVVHAPCKV